MTVNENIKRFRQSRGITKTFMAKGLGMSLQGYSYIESGACRLTVDRLQKIGELFHVDCTVFFSDELTNSAIIGKTA